ncbi:MAG TPA: hypothetical protein VIT18_07080, partial [Terrimicrobiaceae bacterium]
MEPPPALEPAPTPPPASLLDAPAAPSLVPGLEASPTPGLEPPVPEASPEPVAGPSPTEADVIPIEGGAPLETKDIAPARADEAMPDEAYTQPEALVPDQAPAAPPPAVSFESAQERARQVSIRYREVRVQAEKDPGVVSLREQAERARTMEEHRAALRQYYRLLFKKMISIDKSLTDKCRVMETAYLRRLAQERVEPTIPLNPPPTPEPLQ